MRVLIAAVSALALVAACEPAGPAKPTAIAPGAEAYAQLQARLQDAKPGDVIEIGEGIFNFTEGLSLDVDNVTLRGAGIGKTIISFKDQKGAGEGLLVTSDGVTLTGFTMQDTKGDGIKSKDADNITYKDLKVEWTGGPLATNGAYGVYPVESENVLIDGVIVSGASDAGIYVGQSNNIIVRNSRAEYNAGGILVFDLPDLPVKGGHSTRVFNNQIVDNDTQNFAPPGNIVAGVPTGTGVLLMANRNVHVFGNTFSGNKTAHVMIVSYSTEFSDAAYNPLPRDFVIRDNTYGPGGNDPQGRLSPLAPAIGGSLPPIVWDGVTKYGDKTEDVRIAVREKEDVGFISLGLGKTPPDLTKAQPSTARLPDAVIEEPKAVVLPQDKPAA
jgi:hypothetical protein